MFSEGSIPMRKAPYLFALAAIGGLAFVAPSTSASPLASGLGLPAPVASLVLNVQAWSCQEKRSDWSLEQRRFCDGYGYYDDYGDYGPGYGYAYPAPGYGYGYPGYGLGVVPFLSFGFDGGRRHHHRHHGGNWD